MLWLVYLDQEEIEGFHRTDYYLAQIALLIAQAFFRGMEKKQIEDFLIPFVKKETEEPIERNPEEQLALEKASWFAFVGLSPEGLPESIKSKPPPTGHHATDR